MLCLLGFLLGAFIGGMLLVPKGSGLAGGAMVLGYGVVGFVAALVLGVILAIKLSPPRLIRALYLALAGVLLAVVLLFFRYRSMQRAREDRDRQEQERLPVDRQPDGGVRLPVSEPSGASASEISIA
ncbi:MAG: hypothetical protein ACE5G0_05575 [Rhodothermales bacterium]